MTLRERFGQLLSRGPSEALDPDEFVEVQIVPLHQGPLVMTALQAEGIEARSIDHFNVALRTISQVQVLVRRRDASRANTLITAARFG